MWQREPVPHARVLSSRLSVLAQQLEDSEEQIPYLLIAGLTGLCLAPPTEFSSAPAGADALPAPKWLVADRAKAFASVR